MTRSATKWIKVTEALPNAGEVVLIYTNETNVFGRNGELMRAHMATFCQCDQGGNNLLPFRWQGDGPCSWFGQQVTHWARIIPPHQAT